MTESQALQIDEKNGSKESLLEAAEALFSERGYEGVSTRELADRAGVNLGAIQYHFGSKGKLFIETVHRMMRRSACACGSALSPTRVTTPEHTADHIGKLIKELMTYLLRPSGPQGCRVMFRETFTRMSNDHDMFQALVSSVVNEFTRPSHQSLVEVLRVLLRDRHAHYNIHASALSIVGQCFFYATHQPFIERLLNHSIVESPQFDSFVDHIVQFSLRALGCNEELVVRGVVAAQNHQLSLKQGMAI